MKNSQQGILNENSVESSTDIKETTLRSPAVEASIFSNTMLTTEIPPETFTSMATNAFAHVQNFQSGPTGLSAAFLNDPPYTVPAKVAKNIGISFDCENVNGLKFYKSSRVGDSSTALTAARNVQSFSQTALQKATKINAHHPGYFTTDADRAAFLRRRQLQRELDAVEAEVRRLFRSRDHRQSRSVRFTHTSEEISRRRLEATEDSPSVVTIRSDWTNSTDDSNATESYTIIGSMRRADFSGGQTNVMHMPSWVNGASIDDIGSDETVTSDASFITANEGHSTEFIPEQFSHIDTTISTLDTRPRIFSVHNVRTSGVRRMFVDFESAAEVRQRQLPRLAGPNAIVH